MVRATKLLETFREKLPVAPDKLSDTFSTALRQIVADLELVEGRTDLTFNMQVWLQFNQETPQQPTTDCQVCLAGFTVLTGRCDVKPVADNERGLLCPPDDRRGNRCHALNAIREPGFWQLIIAVANWYEWRGPKKPRTDALALITDAQVRQRKVDLYKQLQTLMKSIRDDPQHPKRHLLRWSRYKAGFRDNTARDRQYLLDTADILELLGM